MTFPTQPSASPRKVSMDEEAAVGPADKTFPPYEEFQHCEGQMDVLPDAKASPMEGSDFLAHLLINSRGMLIDNARRITALWTRGTGQELCGYPATMYFEIFGKEDGWILCREVHLAITWREEEALVQD
jgi:hypothetical protein